MRLSAVVAVSDNDVIGRDNALPWHLPADLAHFRRRTMGKPILMGRKTYESIGRPLPGRRNIVMSRGAFSAPGVDTVRTLDEARALVAGEPEMAVIGGEQIFRITLPQLDVIYLTRVHVVVEGQVRMPPLVASEWREAEREDRPADEKNAWAMSFITLERVCQAGAGAAPATS